jgi:hypothetical protein
MIYELKKGNKAFAQSLITMECGDDVPQKYALQEMARFINSIAAYEITIEEQGWSFRKEYTGNSDQSTVDSEQGEGNG